MNTKRKALHLQDNRLFKWHMLAFIFFAILAAYSIIATITYPGNATVPFAVYRGFIIARVSMIIIWGFLLLAHYGLHQYRAMLEMRGYQAHQDLLSRITRHDDSRLRLETSGENFDVIDEEEDNRPQSNYHRK
jgi:hypothetical protein